MVINCIHYHAKKDWTTVTEFTAIYIDNKFIHELYTREFDDWYIGFADGAQVFGGSYPDDMRYNYDLGVYYTDLPKRFSDLEDERLVKCK